MILPQLALWVSEWLVSLISDPYRVLVCGLVVTSLNKKIKLKKVCFWLKAEAMCSPLEVSP